MIIFLYTKVAKCSKLYLSNLYHVHLFYHFVAFPYHKVAYPKVVLKNKSAGERA
jgi:hypothetical protein